MKVIGDIYNIIIIGNGNQEISSIYHILLKHGESNPFIEKVIGKLFETKRMRVKSTYATIRYLIENKIYSLEQNFSKNDLINPKIRLKDAHLVIGLDPYETFINLKFCSEKTVIILNVHHLNCKFYQGAVKKKVKLPSIGCIIDVLDQLVRRVIAFDLYDLSTLLYQSEVYGPLIMLGLAAKEFRELFHYKMIANIIKETVPEPTKFVNAFEYGYNLIGS